MEEINSSASLIDKEYTGKEINYNNLDNINNFNISLKNPIHILNYHKDWIYCLFILNEGN